MLIERSTDSNHKKNQTEIPIINAYSESLKLANISKNPSTLYDNCTANEPSCPQRGYPCQLVVLFTTHFQLSKKSMNGLAYIHNKGLDLPFVHVNFHLNSSIQQ